MHADLRNVSTTILTEVRDAVASGRLAPPIDRDALIALGVRHQLDALTATLTGFSKDACLAILDVTLAERSERRPPPELVWTGPEAATATARDTAVVLRSLFESARNSVILAGYSFDHAQDVLAPLHATMLAHGVSATFFVDIQQIDRNVAIADHLAVQLGPFFTKNWPFGEPRPRLFYDKRALVPGPPWSSLHAKCVVADGTRAFVSSANFTQRGQERNIEVGVLIDEPSFGAFLARQWMGLVDAGLVAEWKGSA